MFAVAVLSCQAHISVLIHYGDFALFKTYSIRLCICVKMIHHPAAGYLRCGFIYSNNQWVAQLYFLLADVGCLFHPTRVDLDIVTDTWLVDKHVTQRYKEMDSRYRCGVAGHVPMSVWFTHSKAEHYLNQWIFMVTLSCVKGRSWSRWSHRMRSGVTAFWSCFLHVIERSIITDSHV